MSVIEILTRVDAICKNTTSTTSTSRNISTSPPLTTPSPAYTPPSTPTSTPLFRKRRRHRTRKVGPLRLLSMPRFDAPKLGCLRKSLNWRDWL
ncbi:hypothetical protein CsSME_00038398 [Camellia sinensis var. sinensis]